MNATMLHYIRDCSTRVLAEAILVLLIFALLYSANNITSIFAQISSMLSAKQLAKYHLEQCISAAEINDTRTALLHCQFADEQLTQLAMFEQLAQSPTMLSQLSGPSVVASNETNGNTSTATR